MPAVQSLQEFDALVARQRDELRAARASRTAVWSEQQEQATAAAVPLRVRIVSLLGEARRHELRHRPSTVAPRTAAAYRNLVRDVDMRLAAMPAGTSPRGQHKLGTEAIGCFSSLLPWTAGVVRPGRSGTQATWVVPQRLTYDTARMQAALTARRTRLASALRPSSAPPSLQRCSADVAPKPKVDPPQRRGCMVAAGLASA